MRAEKNYRRSNKITKIGFSVSDAALTITRRILESGETRLRQNLAPALCDELCDIAQIDICNVKISDAKQWHKKRAGRTVLKQYGYYKPDTRSIHIHNRTAVRGQILAPKTFLNTLLHEWMHHYDNVKLGLDSIHTKGFYMRLKELETTLRAK